MATTKKVTATARKGWTQDKWVTYVSEGLTNAAEGIVQAGTRMHEFKTQSKCCKGGSEFGRLAEEKFGMHPSMSSRWARIGENSRKLLVATKNLPNSMEAVYLVSTLTEDQIEQGIKDGVITHEATQKEIKQLKVDMSVPPPTKDKPPQDAPGPNGNEDEEWQALLEEFDNNEDLCTAIWDEVIDKQEAKKIQQGKVNVKKMAKKLYGNVDDPNMLPSQVASILNLDENEAIGIIGIKVRAPSNVRPKKSYVFEITDDVKQLEKELENPNDAEAMRSEEARQLYEKFKRIVELWSEIIEEN